MSKVSLKAVENEVQKYADIEDVKKEIKRVQSIKCRLRKQKAREDYDVKMAEVVSQEQLLKEVRDYMEPKKVTVTTMTWEQVQDLDYDETIKALKSIQSKKSNTRYLTEDESTNVEYQEALKIEAMLKEHRENIKPVEETVVRKSEINNLIEHVENLEEKVSKEYIVELLKGLVSAE